MGACPHCGSPKIVTKGRRLKKLETIRLFCAPAVPAAGLYSTTIAKKDDGVIPQGALRNGLRDVSAMR
jgi:hypothetical protein